MAYNFNGTSQYLSMTSAPVTVKPVTIASFARPTSGSSDVIPVQIGTSTTSNRFLQYISGPRAVGSQINDASTATSITTPTNIANGTWRHCGSTFPDVTLIAAFINGTKATLAATKTPTGIDRMTIGARTTADLFFPGDIAEVAVWDVALTDDEVVSLSKGFKPTRIRPQSLVFYSPLIRNLQDLSGGLAITNNNTATVSAHPRIY